MKEYLTIPFGNYKGIPVNEVPMDYLTWMFTKLYSKHSKRELYKSILSYFLTRDIKIKRNKFYFNDYKFINVEGRELPFMTPLVLKNSKGKDIYVIGNSSYLIFVEEINERYQIAEDGKYEALNYLYSGNKMIVERTPDFWFYDNKGLVMLNSFLIKPPMLLDHLNNKFSKNLKNKKI